MGLAEGREAVNPSPRQSWLVVTEHRESRSERWRTDPLLEPAQLVPRHSSFSSLELQEMWRELPGASRSVARCDATSSTNRKRSFSSSRNPSRGTAGRSGSPYGSVAAELARCPGFSVTDNGLAPLQVTQSSYETMSNVTNAKLVDRKARRLPGQPARDASFRHPPRSAFSFETHFNPERRPRASSGIDRPPPPDDLASAIPRRRRQDPTQCQTRIPIRHGMSLPTTRC